MVLPTTNFKKFTASRFVDSSSSGLNDYVQASTIEKGEIVTFEQRDKYVTYRVVAVEQQDGERVTRPDANSGVVGEVQHVIPYLGQLILFSRTTVEMILFIAVPFGLIVVGELRDLARAVRSR